MLTRRLSQRGRYFALELRIKISIFNLMLLVFGFAVGVMWYLTPVPVTPQYDDLFLQYLRPEIPAEFCKINLGSAPKRIGIPREKDYRDGQELYLANHYAEWHRVAIQFARDRYFWREDFEIRPSRDSLSSQTWTGAHGLFARCQGRNTAIAQIDELIAEYGESELRAELNSIPWYRNYLELLRPLGCTAIFLMIFFYRVLRRTDGSKLKSRRQQENKAMHAKPPKTHVIDS